jgi:hypothetical protein
MPTRVEADPRKWNFFEQREAIAEPSGQWSHYDPRGLSAHRGYKPAKKRGNTLLRCPIQCLYGDREAKQRGGRLASSRQQMRLSACACATHNCHASHERQIDGVRFTIAARYSDAMKYKRIRESSQYVGHLY